LYSFSYLQYFGSTPDFVKIVEVGARDGLQNEKKILDAESKVKFIDKLSETGLSEIEAGAFVSPDWVPQMANSDVVMQNLKRRDKITYPVLVPNLKGLERAMAVKATEIAVFASSTESFSKKNLNCTIAKSFDRIRPVVDQAIRSRIKVRGYVSVVMGCPYEGEVELSKVVSVVSELYKMGCYEISLGDTIGVGTTSKTFQLIKAVKTVVPLESIAVHFHDTYGQALVNILTAIQMGVRAVDSSVGGLGGCPYAKGASGNVATEEVVYLLKGLGIETGVDIEKLIKVGSWICSVLGRQNSSKVGLATENKSRLLL